jgi:predicted nucleotidyltransferase
MHKEILGALCEFEKEYGFKVIHAVESGSRGWGFASEDADYDVRFVYHYPTLRYLTIRKPKDCVNRMDGVMDFEGYDIHKFYDLLWKSNMNIIDWLMQDVIYVDGLTEKKALKHIVREGFDRRTYVAHNYGLAKANYFKYFGSPSPDEPTIKRYVYCLRALLSAQYCYDYHDLAPLKFADLVKATCTPSEQSQITEMVELKKATKEKQRYSNFEWETFIKSRITDTKFPDAPDHTQQERYLSDLDSHLLRQLSVRGVV